MESSVEFENSQIDVGTLYSHYPLIERSEVGNQADGGESGIFLSLTNQKRKLETNRLLFLKHVDQAVQNWSKVSNSGEKMEEHSELLH